MEQFYIIWLSSKGSKEIYTITDQEYIARSAIETFNNYYKEKGQKARAYYTICENGKPYNHKEVKIKTTRVNDTPID